MENSYTGNTVYVVGVWRGNVWLGEGVYDTELAATGAARLWNIGSVVTFTVERMREIAGADIGPQHYWIERGIR